MKVSRQESMTYAYVLEGADLEVICDRLNRWITEFNFEIECNDSLKREFANVGELLGFENPPAKDIRMLRIKGYSEDIKTRFWIRFDKDSMKNIFISIEGDEETAVAMNDILEERLSAMRPWYTVLARPSSYFLIYGIVVFLFVAFVIRGFIKGHVSTEGLSNALQTGAVISWVIPIVLGVATAIILDKVKLSIFPMGVFALGQGAKRHKDKEILRTGVIIAFAISLVSSAVIALLLP